jgi:phospho-N-acetylmuramoyl-pentapeptide-transferase
LVHLPIVAQYALPFVISCLVSAILLPYYIGWMRQHHIGQYLREEGPATHAVKAKTPTMGGVCFMIATFLGFSVWWVGQLYKASYIEQPILVDQALGPLVVLLLALCGGLLGFWDDLAKILGKGNRGLSARMRLSVEALLGCLFGVLVVVAAGQHTTEWIVNANEWILKSGFSIFSSTPRSHVPTVLVLPPIIVVLSWTFIVAATTNAVNLHDGMDGLAAGTAFMVLLSLSLMARSTDLSCLALAAAGSLLGFLIFNCHPAKVFMGDTGSLFIGALIAGLVLASGLLLYFIPLSAIYIAETVSVMLQVIYFKLTKPYEPPKPMSSFALCWLKLTKKLPGEGKRIFRMAPLHHHFEAELLAKGYNQDKAEWLVVGSFWCTQFILCAITLLTYFSLS